MVLEDSTEVRRGNTYEQVERIGSKEMDGCPLTIMQKWSKSKTIPSNGKSMHKVMSKAMMK
jgi:hypothetical protein